MLIHQKLPINQLKCPTTHLGVTFASPAPSFVPTFENNPNLKPNKLTFINPAFGQSNQNLMKTSPLHLFLFWVLLIFGTSNAQATVAVVSVHSGQVQRLLLDLSRQ